VTPAQHRLRAQVAAHSRLAHTSGSDVSAPARAGFMAKWEREVDPNCALPIEERHRRAKHALTAHMQRLSLKSAVARAHK